MKQRGAKCGVATGFDEVWLVWHRTVREALLSSEKAYGPACKFSVARSVFAGGMLLAMELGPIFLLAGVFVDGLKIFGVVGIVLLTLAVGAMVGLAQWTRGSIVGIGLARGNGHRGLGAGALGGAGQETRRYRVAGNALQHRDAEEGDEAERGDEYVGQYSKERDRNEPRDGRDDSHGRQRDTRGRPGTGRGAWKA